MTRSITAKPNACCRRSTEIAFVGADMQNDSHFSVRPLDRFLTLLRGVCRAGAGWRADCPNGHANARGTLAIVEADDGRLLMTCFACSDTPGILAAVGLRLADLYPDRLRDPSPETRKAAREAVRRSAWSSALSVLATEAAVVSIAAHDLAQGLALSSQDHDRLMLAVQRIDTCREVLAQ